MNRLWCVALPIFKATWILLLLGQSHRLISEWQWVQASSGKAWPTLYLVYGYTTHLNTCTHTHTPTPRTCLVCSLDYMLLSSSPPCDVVILSPHTLHVQLAPCAVVIHRFRSLSTLMYGCVHVWQAQHPYMRWWWWYRHRQAGGLLADIMVRAVHARV